MLKLTNLFSFHSLQSNPQKGQFRPSGRGPDHTRRVRVDAFASEFTFAFPNVGCVPVRDTTPDVWPVQQKCTCANANNTNPPRVARP